MDDYLVVPDRFDAPVVEKHRPDQETACEAGCVTCEAQKALAEEEAAAAVLVSK